MKHVPRYWWDFSRDTKAVIIESDDDRFPMVARYPIMGDSAERAIAYAEIIIDDLKAGRADPRKLAKLVRADGEGG